MTSPTNEADSSDPGSTGRRPRRTTAEMQSLRAAIYDVVAEYQPMTVRQVFYQLVSRGLIDKSENEYKSTVCRLLGEMRHDGTLPYHWIADHTRWMRKPYTYDSAADMLEHCQRTYRQSLWRDQEAYVEIWLEKDALSGVLIDVTDPWDVPLMVTRGYPSTTFVYDSALAMAEHDKPTFLYYFGDHDPSGVDIDRSTERKIRKYAPDLDLTFTRVAVVPDQIEQMKLPSRPTKKSDSRSRSFDGESVEVDSIDPHTLRQICEDCITGHIDNEIYQRTLVIEAAERETIATAFDLVA